MTWPKQARGKRETMSQRLATSTGLQPDSKKKKIFFIAQRNFKLIVETHGILK